MLGSTKVGLVSFFCFLNQGEYMSVNTGYQLAWEMNPAFDHRNKTRWKSEIERERERFRSLGGNGNLVMRQKCQVKKTHRKTEESDSQETEKNKT